jgi:hypothetical protein
MPYVILTGYLVDNFIAQRYFASNVATLLKFVLVLRIDIFKFS